MVPDVILGDGFLADGIREAFGHVPWTWVADHPSLIEREYSGPVVISTPVLVGTIARLERENPAASFAYVPENVREAHPEDWKSQARFIVGTRDRDIFDTLKWDLAPTPCLLMSPESAEMVKHGINAFLALSIGFGMDVAEAAARHGADPDDVALGMMSDPRIGEGAYLKPFGRDIGPNLQREVDNLARLRP